MTKLTEPGGLVGGTVVALGRTFYHSLPVNSL